MQDRYAADLGDFLKLGLLRWLLAPSVDAHTHRLGVVWYRSPDESHNGDGKHVTYLDPASAVGRRLFLVVPAPAHRAHLQARLHDLERSHWAGELVVYWVADR